MRVAPGGHLLWWLGFGEEEDKPPRVVKEEDEPPRAEKEEELEVEDIRLTDESRRCCSLRDCSGMDCRRGSQDREKNWESGWGRSGEFWLI